MRQMASGPLTTKNLSEREPISRPTRCRRLLGLSEREPNTLPRRFDSSPETGALNFPLAQSPRVVLSCDMRTLPFPLFRVEEAQG